MKFTILFGLALACLAAAAPPKEDQLIITKDFFPEAFSIYTADHDIVEIVVPINKINYPENLSEDNLDVTKFTIFFVEADLEEDGTKDYKGLYVFYNNEAKKVLDNGQSVTYAKDKTVYFGAKDGIYKYNVADQTATKYGSVTESVIQMGIDTENAHVYYLTEDYVLYKYNENEVASAKVDAVKDAKDFVFDFDGHLFYYDGNNKFYTYNGEGVLPITGLPANPTHVEIIRAPVLINEVYAIIDGSLYELKVDGTAEKSPIKFQSKPTAFAPDTVFFQYYAYKQKIYLYNLITLLESNSIEDLNEFFSDNEAAINNIKTQKVTSQL